jgi:SAM-dependent methyltransferase
MSRSKSYIFEKEEDGTLSLVGNFEGYYQDNEDPWEQESNSSDMAEYYAFSRDRLVKCINSLDQKQDIMEIGCGLGVVSNIIKDGVDNSRLIGVDISQTAIEKAQDKYSDIKFIVGDISSESFKVENSVDIVVFNQMLWYVLEHLEQAIDNAYNTIANNGYLIISVAFLNEQNYGKDIIDGFNGLLEYCNKIESKFELVYSDLDESKKFDYNDGIVCLKKRRV